MKTALRRFLLTVVLLATLATVALVSALQSWSAQDAVRLIINGQPVHLHIGQDVGWVALTAGIALVMLLVFLIVPLVVVLAVLLALAFGAAAAVLSLAAALSPLLLLGAVAWWIFSRSAGSTPATPVNPASPVNLATAAKE
ncbi:MAG: hypothetical protein ACKO8N_11895 [Rubrivivax sp.]